MENSKKKMLREVSNDHLTPKKRDDLVQSEIFGDFEEDDFRKNGGVMNHETVESMGKRNKPFTVDYTGFGWLLVKKGVFEGLEYPWFAPKMQVFESGAVQDMCGEDVSFCLDAKEQGIDTWCDPRIRVGHEKTRVI